VSETTQTVDSSKAESDALLAGAVPLAASSSRPLCNPDEPLSVRDLFDAGVHFGHQTKRWNPKMRPYIYGARNGVHIVDLDQSARLLKRAFGSRP